MSSSIFTDKTKQPDEKRLSEVLGETFQVWEEIKRHLKTEYGEMVEEWKFYGQKYGWTLKTLRKKRNLFFFIPVEGYFKLTFVFGDRAVADVEKSELPADIINTLKNARKYAEGRGLQIEIKSSEDIDTIKKLVQIKVNN